MVRNPIAAGQFYPASPLGLKRMIESLVDDKAKKVELVVGLVSPHAGYVYSGAVAGAVISRIKFKDTVVILGPNHTGRGKAFSIMTEGVWRTPLGDVEIDSELGRHVLAASSYLEEDFAAHQYEHSLEVQVPFLQYFKPDVMIVPIVLAHASGAIYKKIGRELATAIKESKKGVIILASSDMTHYEPHESAKRKDSQAIEAMLDLDEDKLLKRVDELDISMCGYAPVVSLISAAKELGAKKGELVKYQTSGDTSGDYSSVVGYAGIIVK
jgi:AmmeMemoRadiSam system protein B